MKRTRLLAIAAALAVAVAVAPAPAAANPFPATMLADSSLHTYCYTAGFDTDQSIASYAMNTVLDGTTDMTDSFTAGNCANLTLDVWWWEENLPGTTRGMWECVDQVNATTCDSSDITLDFAELDEGINDWYDRRKTSVHEVGHSVGLGHDAISAMISGEVPGIGLVWRRYSPHDLAHINANY
jgi:hypothetical protein